MAQYFEVLSQTDGSVEQGGQFFNGNQESEPTQVRYILADDSRQFQAQQLILSADQVMVVDGSQQQIQGVVIDQSQITYQQANQPQQYSAVVQPANLTTQQPQQIYYMETNAGQVSENLQTVQTVIEQASAIQQSAQASTQPQPIVLNHQIGTSTNIAGNRQVVQATTQKPVLHIRTPIRQGHIQINPQNRPMSAPIRSSLPQQVRPHQSTSLQMRSMAPQVQMRVRAPIQQVRQPGHQIQQRPLVTQPKSQQMVSMINRQINALRQQAPPIVQQQQQQTQPVVQQQQPQQIVQQTQPVAQMVANQVQKSLNEFQRQQQQLKSNEQQEMSEPVQKTVSIGKQIEKPLSDFRPLSEEDVEELDDHDPSMNSSPSAMVSYKKFLEQREQISKNPLFARLGSTIKVTQTPSSQQPQQPQPQQQSPPQQKSPPQQSQPQQCNISQTIDDVVNQVTQQSQLQQQQMQSQAHPQSQQSAQQQQHPMTTVQQANAIQNPQLAQKKPRAPPRIKNPNPTPRNNTPVRQRAPKLPQAPQNFAQARVMGPQQPPAGPRFALNQQQPRFANQQQLMQQRMAQHQQAQTAPPQQQAQPVHQPPAPPPLQSQPQQQIQQNGGNQSQMNYLITPPTPNKPRQQRPLPAYIPSSQIQQIIESTPIAEEFSDSIRMLVLLENGEQRLITFTLPKEACTIQEILEQVNVPFTAETKIQVTEANTNGINYIVTVGNVSNIAYAATEEEPQEAASPESHPQQQMAAHPPNRHVQQPAQQPNSRIPYIQKPISPEQMPPMDHPLSPTEPPKPPTPEPPKELPPKLIPGKLAVCVACGYTGEDFNRCTRCLRKLPENVKSVGSHLKIDLQKQSQLEMAKHLLNHVPPPIATSTPMKPAVPSKTESVSAPLKQPSPTKKKVTKSKPVENESVVISSDEEEDEKKPVKSVRVSEQLLKNLSASISISPVTKEPSLTEIKKHLRKLSSESADFVKISLLCRTVRIGSYRFVPTDDVVVDSKCVVIKAPVTDNKNEIKTIRIDRGDIVKVLVCFNKSLPVIFYYLNVAAAPIIRDMLNMKKENGFYYDPIEEKEDSYRKITLLPEDFGEEHKHYFNQLYGQGSYSIMDELTAKEANEILIKTCPKDASSATNLGYGKFIFSISNVRVKFLEKRLKFYGNP